MPITIKEIAALAGVSIGTVDRALHDRGRVNSDIAKKIKNIAKENGFEPSRAGRALALAKKPVKIGVIAHLVKTEFMQQLVLGIEQAKAELESLGAEVLVVKLASLNAQEQVSAIDYLLKEKVQGIALSPANDDVLRTKIDMVVERQKIPFITFNTDVPSSKRMCFVGLDNVRSGRTAAGLMAEMLGNKGKVMVVTGHLTNSANSLRMEGFLQEIKETFKEITIAGVQFCYDEDDIAQQVTTQALEDMPDLAGIIVVGGGHSGVCKAVEKAGVAGQVKVIMYDLIPPTLKGIEKGTINFLIDQNAYMQGYQPPKMLFELLFDGEKPKETMMYTDITIKNKYNI